MSDQDTSVGLGKNLNGVIKIEASQIHSHLDSMVRSTVEDLLNKLLDEEADQLCHAARYEHSETRCDRRAGHYPRTYHAKAGMLNLKIPKLRKTTFETAIIERYRRREASVEEALIEMYLAGVSVRRVEDITEALWGTKVSPGTVSELNKKIYAQENRDAALEKAAAVVERLESMRLSKAAQTVREGIAETLSYYYFPREHWTRIRTNNMLERIMKEIRRRTRVVGSFPDGQSALMLTAARLRHIAGTKWSTTCYLNMRRLQEQHRQEQAETANAAG